VKNIHSGAFWRVLARFGAFRRSGAVCGAVCGAMRCGAVRRGPRRVTKEQHCLSEEHPQWRVLARFGTFWRVQAFRRGLRRGLRRDAARCGAVRRVFYVKHSGIGVVRCGVARCGTVRRGTACCCTEQKGEVGDGLAQFAAVQLSLGSTWHGLLLFWFENRSSSESQKILQNSHSQQH
jgi:hypothetical protein